MYVKEEHQKWIPTSTSMPKNSVFETEYTFFNQNKEMYVKEDYQYLSPFKKCIPTKTSMPKSFSV